MITVTDNSFHPEEPLVSFFIFQLQAILPHKKPCFWSSAYRIVLNKSTSSHQVFINKVDKSTSSLYLKLFKIKIFKDIQHYLKYSSPTCYNHVPQDDKVILDNQELETSNMTPCSYIYRYIVKTRTTDNGKMFM